MKYFEKYQSPFEKDPESPSKSKRTRIALADNVFVRDIDVVEACYFLLRSEPKFYRHKWKWSVFIKKYSFDDDYEVAWYVIKNNLYSSVMIILILGFLAKLWP